jgi:hypothetical protein
MTAKVKSKSNGAVTLNVNASVGAYRGYIRALAALTSAGEDIEAQADAADAVVGWLCKYGGMTEGAVDELPFGQLGEVLAQAGQAFTIPKQTSAP